MTREEELDWIYRLRSEIYVYMPKEWLIPMNDALDMAIKALEQEPFINKTCVSSEVCEHDKNKVLDKLDEIITDALDKSTDQKESQTLRWVLDKISEVLEDESID